MTTKLNVFGPLVARVRYIRGTEGKKARTLTGVTICLASGEQVALAKLPYHYTEDQALREFRIAPARFTLMPPGAEIARMLGLIPPVPAAARKAA